MSLLRSVVATILKELLELRRDRAGLMVLLVMPMALVLILSLVQDSVMQATGEAPIKVLYVDDDSGYLGQAIEKRLRDAGGIALVKSIGAGALTEAAARKAVARGDYQFCVVVPKGSGEALRRRLRSQAAAALSTKATRKGAAASGPAGAVSDNAAMPALAVEFDPAVQPAFRTAVVNALRQVLLGIEMTERGAALSETLPGELKKLVGESMPTWPGMSGSIALPDIRFEMDGAPVLALTETVAYASRYLKRPTAAQHNVPAWTLFGMFFIVVPLSGSLIRERQSGTYRKLMAMPVSPTGLLAGKIAAYVLVCMAQFALMLAVGTFVLPLLGTSGLVPGPEFLAVVPIALAAALAAAGYGIMVGTLARSYEQASMFGAVSIVIAAALGGIMVPVYVMPRFMQQVSVVSPLAWGLNGFQDVFVRGGGLQSAGADIFRLLAFFVVTMIISRMSIRGADNG
jgi:ABC-2 type transport system permease protein